MKNNSDNAGELAKQLSLQGNYARQASITAETLEVVAGTGVIFENLKLF